MFINDEVVWSTPFQFNQGYSNNLCGSNAGWKELFYRKTVEVPHHDESFSLKFTSTLN
jgi:hypothetical protein